MSSMTEDTTQEESRAAAARAIIGEQGYWNPGEDLEPLAYDDCVFDAGAAEYLVITDAEADERVAAYVKNSLWAFNASFLVYYVPEGVDEDILQMISAKCEGGNDAMLGLVGSRLEELTEDAVQTDGRGHFLSGYDGEEIEGGEIDGYNWFAYRTN